MAQPLELEANSKLLERIVDLETREHTPFEILSCKREAERVLKEDAALGYMYLGILAGIERNVEEMVRLYDLAIANDSSSCAIFSNYGASLLANGLFDEAVEQNEKAIRLPAESCETVGGGIPNLVQSLAVSLAFSGRFIESAELLEKHQMDLDDQQFPFDSVCNLANFMRANGLSDSDLEPISKALNEVVDYDPSRLTPLLGHFSVSVYEESPNEAVLHFWVDASPEAVSDMQFDYIERLARKDYSSLLMDSIKVSFEVATEAA